MLVLIIHILNNICIRMHSIDVNDVHHSFAWTHELSFHKLHIKLKEFVALTNSFELVVTYGALEVSFTYFILKTANTYKRKSVGKSMPHNWEEFIQYRWNEWHVRELVLHMTDQSRLKRTLRMTDQFRRKWKWEMFIPSWCKWFSATREYSSSSMQLCFVHVLEHTDTTVFRLRSINRHNIT